MVSSRECSFSLSKIDDNCWASPLLVVLGSLFAVKSNTLRPLKTNPTMTPSNASSIRCLVLFHRPPTWIVDCLLNTLSWCPANSVGFFPVLYYIIVLSNLDKVAVRTWRVQSLHTIIVHLQRRVWPRPYKSDQMIGIIVHYDICLTDRMVISPDVVNYYNVSIDLFGKKVKRVSTRSIKRTSVSIMYIGKYF